jgi:hypothetical protein
MTTLDDVIAKYMSPFNPKIHSEVWYSTRALMIAFDYLHREGSLESADIQILRDAGWLKE